MTIEYTKRMLDACYLAKRVRELLPTLPDGVQPSYIHYLDIIRTLEGQGVPVKVSDISAALDLPRPGVTRTVKKEASPEDGRVTYLTITEAGQELSREYDTEYFRDLAPDLAGISDEEAETMIRTIEKLYQVMSERRNSLEKR